MCDFNITFYYEGLIEIVIYLFLIGVQIGNKISDQTFHADHPFVFYIEDESTGTILYIGKMMNPLQQEGSTGNVKIDLTSNSGQGTRPSLPPTSGKGL